MRFIFAFAVALVITMAIFIFMQSLIGAGRGADIQLVVHSPIEILHPKPDESEPELKPDTPEETPREPLLESLEITAPVPPAPRLTPEMDYPALDLDGGDFEIQRVGHGWSAPLSASALPVAGGEDAQGYVEVIPYSTRRPNVPELAWQNKVNGWVLVAFSLTADGNTRNVRVLDANPRGIFEEKVIAAVKDWQYQLNYSGKARGEVILTQKVEVSWENYPQNIPNVD